MNRDLLIGRKEECNRLDRCMNSNQAQLIIVYGRRRVGKTFLINEYFENKFAFKLTGTFGQPKNIQLRNFASELARKSKKEIKTPKDWFQAFNDLRDYLEDTSATQKQVVFFDEMPWLDTHKSGFLPAFEWFWNDWASTCHNLIFIVCGSATSWMVDNIANNKGGLFNRQTCKLYLEPFKLYEVEQYLESRNINWSRYDIAECYMIMGGIPYYLSLLDYELSFNQNIDYLFFKNKSELWDEFNHLYRTLFTNSDSYIKVVNALANKKSGLTRKEISQETGLPFNGKLTTIINNLVDSGFIKLTNLYGNKKKEDIFQLSDYYTLFYFEFIHHHSGKDEHYWSNTIDTPARSAWSGLTYELLCKDHIKQIKYKLGISGILTEQSTWYIRGDSINPGTQIDLLINRRDRTVNLCEIKFSLGEYIIDKTYDTVLRNKIDLFRKYAEPKKSISLTMITTYGVKPNKYSNIIQNQITLDDLFVDN